MGRSRAQHPQHSGAPGSDTRWPRLLLSCTTPEHICAVPCLPFSFFFPFSFPHARCCCPPRPCPAPCRSPRLFCPQKAPGLQQVYRAGFMSSGRAPSVPRAVMEWIHGSMDKTGTRGQCCSPSPAWAPPNPPNRSCSLTPLLRHRSVPAGQQRRGQIKPQTPRL